MAVVEPVETPVGARRRLRLRNPATLEEIGEIEVQTASDVRAAIERARKAQPGWASLRFDERARYLERAVRVLLERQDEFLDVIVRETGKPRAEALAVELLAACDALTFYARRAKRILADRTLPVHLMKTKKLRISYRPLGVAGIITPWNFPFLLSLNPTAQALMAGNTVVLKPSEITPFSGQLVEKLLEEAGLPEGVFSLVLGDGETGAALVEAGVNKISFTGSVRTGRRVGEACGRNLVPCTLELGGKDPMIVCADADLERAANGAVYGAFSNAGQVCVSTERVYVVEEIHDAFVEKVVAKTAQLRQGADGEFEIGPMISRDQLAIVERHVEDARARGAAIRTGGRRNPAQSGLFFEPTVLTGVSHEMAIMREETFGPVLPIMRVRDEEEALRLANDSPYGLNANVWTRDKRKGERMAKALESGSAVVNDCMLTYGVTESPFGGVKESGVGQVNGEIGLRSFCHAQSILIDRFGAKSEILWYPYTSKKLGLLRRAMRLLWGTPLGRLLS
ncbi:MAG TPA: succinic semialdehyde dehydrogenase [Myxococcota bacterium]|jgi:acyl-CoA reductase-like NAD-dependent aldehyde dehydrogenase|nr:succinic semialdehyde dehydrogenase [Myxococcota bacterium]